MAKKDLFLYSAVIYLILSGNVILSAEKVKQISLNEAIQAALENNLKIQSKQAEVEIAKAAVQTAGARQNPFAEGIGSRAENTYSGGLGYLFETGGKRRKRIKVAEESSKAIEQDYESNKHSLIAQTRKLYSQFVTDLETLKVKENSRNLSAELVTIARKRFEAGDAPSVDIKISSQALLNNESEILTLKNQLIQDRLSLNLLLSLSSNENWLPLNTFDQLLNLKPLKPETELDQLALKNRADLQRLIFEKKSAEAQLLLAKANRIPNIQENLALVMSNALNTSSNPDHFTTNIRADTIIEIPFFNRQQGSINEAKAKLHKFDYDELALKQQIENDITSSSSRISSMKSKIALSKQNVDSSFEIANLIEKGYQAGRMNILQVISARQSLSTAQDNYYSNANDYFDALSDLENAVNMPLEEVFQ